MGNSLITERKEDKQIIKIVVGRVIAGITIIIAEVIVIVVVVVLMLDRTIH